jgi:hypothetical protein
MKMLKNPLTSKSSNKYFSQHSSKSPNTGSQTPKKEKRKHTHTHTHLFSFHTTCSKAPGTWIPRSAGLQTFKLRKKYQ